MRAQETTVEAYLAALPAGRRAAIAKVRDAIRAKLPPGFEEGMQYGMISYHVPLSRYPDTYNGQPLGLAALASQKQHMAVYLMAVYSDPALETWFVDRYRASGKKLDMGKSCVRFKELEDLPLDVIGETLAKVSVDRLIATHEAARAGAKTPTKKPSSKKATAKKATTKRAK